MARMACGCPFETLPDGISSGYGMLLRRGMGNGMIGSNLRHLRVFLALAETGSATGAAERCRLSQPAVTQAMARLAALAGAPLFLRVPRRFVLTDAGRILERRARRAFALLDGALSDVDGRLVLTTTRAQVDALIATAAAQGFTLAARDLGLAQPTVHRAVAQLERAAGRPLFQRTQTGVLPTRAGRRWRAQHSLRLWNSTRRMRNWARSSAARWGGSSSARCRCRGPTCCPRR